MKLAVVATQSVSDSGFCGLRSWTSCSSVSLCVRPNASPHPWNQSPFSRPLVCTDGKSWMLSRAVAVGAGPFLDLLSGQASGLRSFGRERSGPSTHTHTHTHVSKCFCLHRLRQNGLHHGHHQTWSSAGCEPCLRAQVVVLSAQRLLVV